MKEIKFDELKDYEKDLIEKAESVMKNAYNLYTHFYVGSAILMDSGKIYLGTFAENSSAGGTICAERAAILAANTDKERKIKSIVVIGAAEGFDAEEPVAPCGMCRQFIYDFSQIAGHDIEIICSNTKKTKLIKTSINELLPFPFGPRDVGQNLERFR